MQASEPPRASLGRPHTFSPGWQPRSGEPSDLSREGRGSASTRFALGRTGGSWRAARGGCLQSRVLTPADASACLRSTRPILTYSDEEDALDRAREIPAEEEEALAARRPVLFRLHSPAARASITVHRVPALG